MPDSGENTVTEWQVVGFDDGDAVPDVLLDVDGLDEATARAYADGTLDDPALGSFDCDPPYGHVVVRRRTVTYGPWKDVSDV